MDRVWQNSRRLQLGDGAARYLIGARTNARGRPRGQRARHEEHDMAGGVHSRDRIRRDRVVGREGVVMVSFTAALLLAQAQPPLPPLPSQAPQQEPQILYETAPPVPVLPATPDTPPKRRHDDGRTERERGLTALVAGYLMGSLIVVGPALFTKDGREPVQNTGEKRLALIPVAGPMVWWFNARARLDAGGRARCIVDFDSGFHDILGILTSNEEVASSAAPPVAKLHLSPTPGVDAIDSSDALPIRTPRASTRCRSMPRGHGVRARAGTASGRPSGDGGCSAHERLRIGDSRKLCGEERGARAGRGDRRGDLAAA